jgi:hypothetical protein
MFNTVEAANIRQALVGGLRFFCVLNFFLKLKSDSSLCVKMGYNARQYFCNHFTKDIAINKYLDVIDNIRRESSLELITR